MTLDADDLIKKYKEHILIPWSNQGSINPLLFIDKKGVYVTTHNNQRLFDMKSQAFCANLGHAHEGMLAALTKAAPHTEVLASEVVCVKRLELAEKLLSLANNNKQIFSKLFFTLGGAEANENAIKIARAVTKKHKIITRYRSYHGATLATINHSGDYRRIPFDSAVTGIVRFPDPYERGSKQKIDTVKLLQEIIEIEGAETIAAIMLEGITGANGAFIPPDDYWPRIRELCDRYGILLIDDEVFSGFYRTGPCFAIDRYKTSADMITVSKGLTAGYAPLGGVIVSKKVADFFNNETLWCGLTQYAPYLSCVAALSAIAAYENENIENNVYQRGEELKETLQNWQNKYGVIAEVRSIGLLAAIDFRKSKDNDSPLVPYRANTSEMAPALFLQNSLKQFGISALVRFSMLILAPPLNITQLELNEALNATEKAIAALDKKYF